MFIPSERDICGRYSMFLLGINCSRLFVHNVASSIPTRLRRNKSNKSDLNHVMKYFADHGNL